MKNRKLVCDAFFTPGLKLIQTILKSLRSFMATDAIRSTAENEINDEEKNLKRLKSQ